MPARTKKTPIVIVYDCTEDGRFAVYDEGALVIEVSDKNANYWVFRTFCDKFNIPYEDRDMPESLEGEEFPFRLEDLEPKATVCVEIDEDDPEAFLFLMDSDGNTLLDWVSKADALVIRDRLVEALGKC